MKPKRIGIICGGRSGEHEISLLSANSIFNNIDRSRFEPVLIGIDKKGRFVMHENLILDSSGPRTVRLNPEAKEISADIRLAPASIEIAFPIIHGTYGEDGSLRGFLKILGIPFAGPDVYASADCMNKITTKKLLRCNGLPICKFMEASRSGKAPSYSEASSELGGTMFVKPARLGSSVGISRCFDEQSYHASLELAFRYDNLILIEENFPGREIEFAVMGNHQVEVSPPGEVIPVDSFYSYAEKYDTDSKTQLVAPAPMDEELREKLADCAKRAYTALLCTGFARVDLMLKKNGDFIVNEINTLPGFTKISMFPTLFQKGGISYPDIITRIIDLGIEVYNEEQKLERSL